MGAETASLDVEISIVTLGDVGQLARCAVGLPAACAGVTWALTVVDNSPRGLDLRPLLAGLPATVVRSDGPCGFAANQNLVLGPLVDGRRARYVLILNDDTELDGEAVARLVGHADADPRIGAVSPAIRNGAGRREPDRYAWPTLREATLGAMLPRRTARPAPDSGWLNGAAILVRAAALAQVGVLDPSFFLFFEETDLCLRLVRAGWRLAVCPSASLVHHRHGTTGQASLNLRVEQQMLRSRYLFFLKHHGRGSARALAAVTRAGLVLRAAKAIALGRRSGETSRTASVLWSLARYAPSAPAALERQPAERISA